MVSENPYNYCILIKKVFHQYLPRFLDPLEPNEAKIYRLRYWNSAIVPVAMESKPVATVSTACGIETLKFYQQLQNRHWYVATVLTAWGIETLVNKHLRGWVNFLLQQHLPLAVLKPQCNFVLVFVAIYVATALTACGIRPRGIYNFWAYWL